MRRNTRRIRRPVAIANTGAAAPVLITQSGEVLTGQDTQPIALQPGS